MQTPFIEELEEFFHEYISDINFDEISPQHIQISNEISKQYDLLISLLTKDGQANLNNFDNAYGELLSLEVEISYKKGFSEGLNFLFHFFLSS